MSTAHASTPSSTFETITPDRAARDLAKSDNVRGVNLVQVKRFARAMAEGRWSANGESIKYRSDGTLIDGQHRLRACIDAKKPFRSLVVRGIDDPLEIDTGQHRRPDQILSHSGAKNATKLAAAARALWFQLHLGSPLAHSKGIAPGVTEILRTIQEHPGLAHSVESCRRAQKLVSWGLLAAIHYLAQKHFADHAEIFVEELSSGTGLSVGNPVYALRERILARTSSGVGLRRTIRDQLLIKAWNAYALDEKIHSLRAPGEGESLDLVLEPTSAAAREVAKRRAGAARIRALRSGPATASNGHKP